MAGAYKESHAKCDVSARGGVHGRGSQSFAKGKPPASAKQSRPTGQTSVDEPKRRAH